MKIIEIAQSLNIALSNEEHTLYRRIGSGTVFKRDLSEREQHVANQLVNKDVLSRVSENEKLAYKRKTKSGNRTPD
jgi:hypothetical protein